jgi:stage V sporulation protein R
MADQGRLNYEFQNEQNSEKRMIFNKNLGEGEDFIFKIRKNFSDFTLLNTFIDQDFVNEYDLFVVGKRPNPERNTIEYFIKSRKAEDYKNMLINSLYHPPTLNVDLSKTNESNLYLIHRFENKQLVKEYIPDTLVGIEFLWGGQVQLETTEIYKKHSADGQTDEYYNRKVLYTMKDRKIEKIKMDE